MGLGQGEVVEQRRGAGAGEEGGGDGGGGEGCCYKGGELEVGGQGGGGCCLRTVCFSFVDELWESRPTDWFSVPALFFYDLLDDNTLRHRETIKLPGNALDVEAIESSGPSPRLLVAVDNSASAEGESSSLIVLEKEGAAEAGWKQSNVQNLPAAGDIKLSVEELQKILYTTESLRKLTDFD